MRSFLALAATAAALISATPAAAESARPVRCGDVITHDTKLRADLRNCPGNGLVIGADDITLDLAGHTIDGDGVLSCDEQYACDYGVDNTAGHTGVTIEGGTIREFGPGVFADGASGARISRITATHNLLSGLVIVASPDSEITDNTIAANGLTTDQAGITSYASTDLLIARNAVRGNGDIGMYLNGLSSSRLRLNSVSANPESGILLDGGDHNAFRENRVFDNGDNIILSGSDNVVEQNAILASRGGPEVIGVGLIVDGGSRNLVARNVVDGAATTGIRFTAIDPDTTGVAQDNIARGNLVSHAGEDGLLVDDTAPGSVVERNVVSRSGDDGIEVDAATTKVARNLALRNARLGIRAVPGVIDGGGNRASGNGRDAQCQGVACSGVRKV